MITPNQLKQFVSVARHKSITKAAEELFVSQPAISTNIKKIEAELDIQLFYLNNKRLYLTNDGENIYKIAIAILDKYKELEIYSLKNQLQDDKINFNFYASPGIHETITTELPLFDLFSEYSFSFYTCTCIEEFIINSDNNEQSFFLVSIPQKFLDQIEFSSEYVIYEIASMNMHLCTSKDNTHPLFKRKSISLQESKQLPIVNFSDSNSYAYKLFSDEGISFVSHYPTTTLMMKILEKNTNLCALTVDMFLSSSKLDKLISLPISDLPEQKLILIYKNNSEHDSFFSKLTALFDKMYKL